jgi:hypothetical protein
MASDDADARVNSITPTANTAETMIITDTTLLITFLRRPLANGVDRSSGIFEVYLKSPRFVY